MMYLSTSFFTCTWLNSKRMVGLFLSILVCVSVLYSGYAVSMKKDGSDSAQTKNNNRERHPSAAPSLGGSTVPPMLDQFNDTKNKALRKCRNRQDSDRSNVTVQSCDSGFVQGITRTESSSEKNKRIKRKIGGEEQEILLKSDQEAKANFSEKEINELTSILHGMLSQHGFTNLNSKHIKTKAGLCAPATFACGFNTWNVAGSGANIKAAFFTVPRTWMAICALVDSGARFLQELKDKGFDIVNVPEERSKLNLFLLKLGIYSAFGVAYACNDCWAAGRGLESFTAQYTDNEAILEVAYWFATILNFSYTFVLGAACGEDIVVRLPKLVYPWVDFQRERHIEHAKKLKKILDKGIRKKEKLSEIEDYCVENRINNPGDIVQIVQLLKETDKKKSKLRCVVENYCEILITTAIGFVAANGFGGAFASANIAESIFDEVSECDNPLKYCFTQGGQDIQCASSEIKACLNEMDIPAIAYQQGCNSLQNNGTDLLAVTEAQAQAAIDSQWISVIGNTAQGAILGCDAGFQFMNAVNLGLLVTRPEYRKALKQSYFSPARIVAVLGSYLMVMPLIGVPYELNIASVIPLAIKVDQLLTLFGFANMLPPTAAIGIAMAVLGVSFYLGGEIISDIGEAFLRKIMLYFGCMQILNAQDEDEDEDEDEDDSVVMYKDNHMSRSENLTLSLFA